MKKIKLYLDFDGVILDTITVTYQMIEEQKLKTRDEIIKFFQTLDWNNLIKTAPIMNDSINCIRKLIDSNRFNISILTHVNSKGEAEEKIKMINKKFPEISIIPCPKRIDKCDFVSPINSILVDDYLGNLEKWQAKGGISVKFSDKNKQNNKFITITKLDQLLNIDFNMNKEKVYKRV
mgnify:CR=1 FL=1